MRDNSSGRKILVILLTVVLLAVMLAFTYFKFEQIKAVTVEFVSENIGLQQDRDRLARLEKLEDGQEEIRRQYDNALKMMPEEPMEGELIDYIQQKANLAAGRYVEIRFGERTQADGYMDMPVDISFTGGYEDLIAFLESLENGERALRIDGMTVGVTGDGSGAVRADLSAHGFYIGTAAAKQ